MTKIESEVEKMMNAYKLKYIYRYSERTFDGHKESTAAHTWACLIIADYLLDILEKKAPKKYKLDTLKIYKYIMYHDLIEAETGDVDLDPSDKIAQESKKENEKKAFAIYKNKLPASIANCFDKNFTQYEQKSDLESKFVKLCDVVEAEFQSFFHKYLRGEWTEEYYVSKRKKYYQVFPELEYIHEELLDYYRKNQYFKIEK